MGAQRYVYRTDDTGNVCAIPLPKIYRGTPETATGTFHERMKKAYYRLECDGKQWQGPYAKNIVKTVHERAIARGE